MQYSNDVKVYEGVGNINWGAIFAGALIAFIVNVALMSLGAAIGFTSFDPAEGETIGRGTMVAAGVYTVICALISFYAGGLVASRLAGFPGRTLSALHGLCSWAVVSTVVIVMMSIGVGKVVGATFGLIGSSVSQVASAGVSAASRADVDFSQLRQEVRSLLQDTGKTELQPENLKNRAEATTRRAAQAEANPQGANAEDVMVQEGNEVAQAVDTTAIANVISRRMNISPEEAQALVGESEERAQQVWGQVQASAKEAGIQAAEVSADVAATASWLTFLSLLVGAIAAVLGGLSGTYYYFASPVARRTARVSHRPVTNPS